MTDEHDHNRDPMSTRREGFDAPVGAGIPGFTELVDRARRRRQRHAVAGGIAAVLLVVAGGGVATQVLGDRPGAGPADPDPATGGVATPTHDAGTGPATRFGLTAEDVVAGGELYNYAVDSGGDLFATWQRCLDTSRCAYAWRLTRADGSTAEQIYDVDLAGPHVASGPDYFVAKWYDEPGVLVRLDGTSSPLGEEDEGSLAPGAAMAVTEHGVLPVDGDAAALVRLESPTGRPWNQVDVADDGTVWGVDQPRPGQTPVVARREPGASSWQQHELVGSVGVPTFALAGDHLAAFSLVADTSSDPVYPYAEPDGATVTTDGGRTWTEIDPGDLPFDHVDSVAASVNGTLFVADGADVYRSTDAGWTRFAVVPGAGGLARLAGGDGSQPDSVHGYDYDRDRLMTVSGDGDVSPATRQLR